MIRGEDEPATPDTEATEKTVVSVSLITQRGRSRFLPSAGKTRLRLRVSVPPWWNFRKRAYVISNGLCRSAAGVR